MMTVLRATMRKFAAAIVALSLILSPLLSSSAGHAEAGLASCDAASKVNNGSQVSKSGQGLGVQESPSMTGVQVMDIATFSNEMSGGTIKDLCCTFVCSPTIAVLPVAELLDHQIVAKFSEHYAGSFLEMIIGGLKRPPRLSGTS